MAAIRDRWPGVVLDAGRGRLGYERCLSWRDADGGRLVDLLSGGNPGVHVVTSGVHSVAGCELLRGLGRFRLTRADAAVDLVRPGLFDEWARVLRAFAVDRGLTLDHRGDWQRGQSRTLYVGSRRSAVFLRLYEKGWKEAGDPAWIRLEIECKPVKSLREQAATLQPFHLLGASRWLRDAMALLGIAAGDAAAVGTVRRSSADVRALVALLRQYGPVLGRMRERHGEDFGHAIQVSLDLAEDYASGPDHELVTALLRNGVIGEDQMIPVSMRASEPEGDDG